MSAFYKLNNSITLLLRHLKKFTTILDIDANKQLKFHKNPTDSLRVKKSEKNGHLRLTHLKRGTKASSPTQWMAFSACSSTQTAANEHPCAGGRKKKRLLALVYRSSDPLLRDECVAGVKSKIADWSLPGGRVVNHQPHSEGSIMTRCVTYTKNMAICWILGLVAPNLNRMKNSWDFDRKFLVELFVL